jgi:hypothetical protein
MGQDSAGGRRRTRTDRGPGADGGGGGPAFRSHGGSHAGRGAVECRGGGHEAVEGDGSGNSQDAAEAGMARMVVPGRRIPRWAVRPRISGRRAKEARRTSRVRRPRIGRQAGLQHQRVGACRRDRPAPPGGAMPDPRRTCPAHPPQQTEVRRGVNAAIPARDDHHSVRNRRGGRPARAGFRVKGPLTDTF